MDLKYVHQPWSCKEFDEAECKQEIVHNLQEQYNTIFDCLFLPAAAVGGVAGLLLTAHHSGDIRLFNWRQLCSKGLTPRPQCSWRAHEGPVYAVALVNFNNMQLLVTAGGDGLVRLWPQLDTVLAAAAAAAAEAVQAAVQAAAGTGAAAAAAAAGHAVQLQPLAEVLLPHLQNPLGISDGRQPSAQALAVDNQQQQVFIGGSDGGVHAWRLPQLFAAAHALGTKQPPAAAAALSLVPMAGHAAAVLGLDFCSATRQLASASEDGTVRVWDCNSYSCLQIIHPSPNPSRDDPGPLIPLDQPQQLLKCVRSPGNLCVKFDSGGSWLLIGTADGYLVLWHCQLNAPVLHTQCIKSGSSGGGQAGASSNSSSNSGAVMPQVLLVTPSTIYMAGTDKQLHQYSFQLELLRSFEVAAESVFGISHDASSGMLAVCGSRCCVDLLTEQGSRLGCIKPPESVFVPAP